ncbi:hypothetical protein V2J09_009105 [Rumex salicifolius]
MRRRPMETVNKIGSFVLPHQPASCNSAHLIVALVLVVTTSFLSRFLHHSFSPCSFLQPPFGVVSSDVTIGFHSDGSISWPERGFGSYLNLKIYVYDENEIDGLKALMYGCNGSITADDCVQGQWGTQVKIHRLFLKSKFRTMNKDEANFFFVPTYVKCVHMKNILTDNEINQTFVNVLSQMPYFRRSGGRDHVFVFPSGNGAHFFKSWATYINRSIFLTPEGDRTDNQGTSAFNTWKDIIIPGNVDEVMTGETSLIKPLPLSKRKYLATYLGCVQGLASRLQIVKLGKQYPTKLEALDFNLSTDKLEKEVYFEHLRNGKFCLAPRGLSSWTLRVFEAFFAVSFTLSSSLHLHIIECVPVLLSDQIELPFQDVIDYFQVLIKLPSTWIGPQLLDYLESIPDEDVERMIDRGRQVRCLFVYAPESQRCSAIHGIFWELQRKVRPFQQSSETFWLHNRVIVHRDMVPFPNWKTPILLP